LVVAETLRSSSWHVTLVNNDQWHIPPPDWSILRRRLTQAAHTRFRRWQHAFQRPLRPLGACLHLLSQVDLNIFLEHVLPSQFPLARKNLWIPDQEWLHFDSRSGDQVPSGLLDPLDGIWVKSRCTETIFRQFSPRVTYVGFTSFDVHDPTTRKISHSCLHIASRNRLKGTGAILEAWRRNAQWPRITIVQDPLFANRVELSQIDYRTVRLPDTELRALQNSTEFHLDPSEAEGFGQALCETLGMEGIVLTTDAPPMHELVTPARGLLVPYDRTSPQGLGTNFHVSVSALESVMERAWSLTSADKNHLRENARDWFLDNDRHFRTALPDAADAVLDTHH